VASAGRTGEGMKIRLIEHPQKTRNLFEDIALLKGKWLPVLEKNRNGDCLCLVDGRYLIEVFACDIAEES
jgi:hypothetical protein